MSSKDENLLVELVKEAGRVKEDAEHSAKGHFEAARVWGNCNKWIGVTATVLAAVAGASALAEYGVASAGIAVVVAILTGLLTFLKPSECASRHLKAGNAYNGVRNDARIFANIECHETALGGDLKEQLADLNSRRNVLNTDSPQIPRWAYKKGKAGIDAGEAHYRVDD
jgi:hypothetical protein